MNEKIAKWVAKLEEQAEDLLKDVELEELTAKERIDLAMKCLGHVQRFMMVDQQISADQPQQSQSVVLAALVRQMRGEAFPRIDEVAHNE